MTTKIFFLFGSLIPILLVLALAALIPLSAIAQLLDITPIPHPVPHVVDIYKSSNISITVLVPNGTGWSGAVDLGSGSSTIQGIGLRLFAANCSAPFHTYSVFFQATSYPFWIPMHDRILLVMVLSHNKLIPVPMNAQYTNATYGTVNLYGQC